MYRVHLHDFEGPLDLLLFFIRRDELDVYDIPIAQITDEFLGYVRLLEEIDLDGAAEFIYMAALLISIKARMLLPRSELDDDGEPIDPRRELVERLLEYVRFKEVAQQLTAHHDERADLFIRGEASAVRGQFDSDDPETLVNTTLFDLVGALRRILTEAPDAPPHAVARVDYSVEAQQAFVLERLREQPKVSFAVLVRGEVKAYVIATFLAVLELAKQGTVWLARTRTADDFTVARTEEESLDKPTVTNGAAMNGHA